MRKLMILLSAVFGLAVQPMVALAQTAMVDGEVTTVDEPAGKITIKHAPIKKLDMDAMTMAFRVKDPAMLKQVKPGDKIKFDADKVDGQFTVTTIEKR